MESWGSEYPVKAVWSAYMVPMACGFPPEMPGPDCRNFGQRALKCHSEPHPLHFIMEPSLSTGFRHGGGCPLMPLPLALPARALKKASLDGQSTHAAQHEQTYLAPFPGANGAPKPLGKLMPCCRFFALPFLEPYLWCLLGRPAKRRQRLRASIYAPW